MKKYILILTTVPDIAQGEKIAQVLIQERLAACVSISKTCNSFYWWKDKITKDSEHMLFIKTQTNLYPEIEKRIKALHPYEVPEIIALPIFTGSKNYLDWIGKETKTHS